MPRPDDSDRNLHRALAVYLSMTPRKKPKPKKRKGEGGELAPVEPDKPTPLAGGAAAALEYDD